FLAGIIIVRGTGASGKGAFTLAITVTCLAPLILGLGWSRATGYFIARDGKSLGAVLGSNVIVTCLATAAVFTIWQLGPGFVGGVLLRGVSPEAIALALGMVGRQFMEFSIAAAYGGLRAFGRRALFLALSSLLYLASAIGAYAVGHTDVEGYLRWYLVTS